MNGWPETSFSASRSVTRASPPCGQRREAALADLLDSTPEAGRGIVGEPDAALTAHANGSLGRDRLDVQRRRRAAQHVNHLIGDRVQIWPAFHGERRRRQLQQGRGWTSDCGACCRTACAPRSVGSRASRLASRVRPYGVLPHAVGFRAMGYPGARDPRDANRDKCFLLLYLMSSRCEVRGDVLAGHGKNPGPAASMKLITRGVRCIYGPAPREGGKGPSSCTSRNPLVGDAVPCRMADMVCGLRRKCRRKAISIAVV